MADLVIGGNTYQNVDCLQVKQADGGMAIFRQWSGVADKGKTKVSSVSVVPNAPESKITQINKNFSVSIKEGQ